jgi:hypothetical protein
MVRAGDGFMIALPPPVSPSEVAAALRVKAAEALASIAKMMGPADPRVGIAKALAARLDAAAALHSGVRPAPIIWNTTK